MVRPKPIPKNSTCLVAEEYQAYFTCFDRTDPQVGITSVWQAMLPSRRLHPTPTGRHALWQFLELAGLESGDEVLLAAYNFYVVVRLIIQKGLVPVFVDIEPDTLCIDAVDLNLKITPRSRLVLVTHMFGHGADLSRIANICDERNLLLFEDCAHAVATLHEGRQVGQAGDGALFSFGVEKIVNSFGGGMLALSQRLSSGYRPPPKLTRPFAAGIDSAARLCVTLHNSPALHRWTARPACILLGWVRRTFISGMFDPSRDDSDYRFDPQSRVQMRPFMVRMQASQVGRLQDNIERRRVIIKRIISQLSAVPQVRTLDADRHGRSNGAYFAIAVPNPAALSEYLRCVGIGSSAQEFLDCSGLAQFREFAADCPNAREASTTILRLPSYPGMTDTEADRIAAAIARFFGKPRQEGGDSARPAV